MSEYESIPGLEDTYLNPNYKPKPVCPWCKKPIEGKAYVGYHETCWNEADQDDDED